MMYSDAKKHIQRFLKEYFLLTFCSSEKPFSNAKKFSALKDSVLYGTINPYKEPLRKPCFKTSFNVLYIA